MRSPSTRALARLLLLAAVSLASCGREEGADPTPAAESEGDAARAEAEYYAKALESAKQAPEFVGELLVTCNRWRHLDRPCDDEQVRRDLLDCWVKKGERIAYWTEKHGFGPRARYQRTLLEIDLCMEMRRWRRHGVDRPL